MSGISPTPNASKPPEADFSYFAEVEATYQRARGTATLVSPLDWALIESWKDAGVPLEAVRAGVERAFVKYKKRRPAFRKINSLAYCTQEVLRAAAEFEGTEAARKPARQTPSAEIPFEPREVKAYLASNLIALERAKQTAKARNQDALAGELDEVAEALRRAEAAIAPENAIDFQDLETRLTALEEKLSASFTRAVTAEVMADFQREIERGLSGARRNMTVPQIESLSRQFMKRSLFEHYRVPRLSLFYM
jgi:predicted transcriptional regulator